MTTRADVSTRYGFVSINVINYTDIAVSYDLLRINGIDYRGSIVLADYGKGVVRAKSGNTGIQPLTMYRLGHYSQSSTTESARDKVVAELIAVASKWLKDHPESFIEANKQNKLDDLVRLGEQIERYQGYITILQKRMEEINPDDPSPHVYKSNRELGIEDNY